MLVKSDVGVSVAILNADDHVVDNCHTRAVSQKVLVGHLCIILLSLKELMVKIKIVLLFWHKLSCGDKCIDKQFVHLVTGVEVIVSSGIGGVCDVVAGKFFYHTQDGV